MKALLQHALARLRWGIGISAFVLACLALGHLVLPWHSLRAGREGLPDLGAQRVLHRWARGYLRFLVAIGWIRFTFRGTHRLRDPGPLLVVANHPSLLDVVVLCSLLPEADCIVNGPRSDFFLFRGLARPAGYVRNDDPATFVRECVSRLRAGRSLIVFPEGTRSPPHQLGPFRRGAARIALEAGVEIRPVLFHYDPPVMYKGWHWHELPDRAIHATVRVMQPIPSKPSEVPGEGGLSHSAVSRQLNAELRDFFLKGLEIDDVGNA